MLELTAFLIFWIVMTAVAAIVAGNKGRSRIGWGLATFLLSPLVVLILLALKPKAAA